MNIALLSQAFRGDQKEANVITLTTLARFYNQHGHRAVIISSRQGLLKEYEKTPFGVELFKPHRWLDIPIGRGTNPLLFINQVLAGAYAVRTVQKKLGIKFDVLHTSSAAPILVLRGIIGRWLAPKSILVHTIKSHSQFGIGSYLWSGFLNRTDKVVVQINSTLEQLVKNGCRKDKIVIIRSHIDTERWRPSQDKNLLKVKFGWTGRKIVLYYGHLLFMKGVDVWLRVVQQMHHEDPNVYGIIGWSGLGDPGPFIKMINDLELTDVVTVMRDGYDIVEMVNAADVALFPYPTMISTEANPSCIIECLACGTPVVTSRLQELSEVFSEGKNILMAEPGQVSDYVKKLFKLLRDQLTANSVRQGGYAIIDQFSLSRVGQQYLDLYSELLNANK